VPLPAVDKYHEIGVLTLMEATIGVTSRECHTTSWQCEGIFKNVSKTVGNCLSSSGGLNRPNLPSFSSTSTWLHSSDTGDWMTTRENQAVRQLQKTQQRPLEDLVLFPNPTNT